MNTIKNIYCRLIKFLFLRSHSVTVVVRRNGQLFGPKPITRDALVFNDGIEIIEISMIPNHRTSGSFVRIR